jgi:uncharacterized protein (DUF2141 family)
MFFHTSRRLAACFWLVLSLCGGAISHADEPDRGADAAPTNPDPCRPESLAVRIRVRNVLDSVGTITVDLHGDVPDDFLKKQIARVRVPAIRGETLVCIPVDHAGRFAIALYHDRNSNRHLDKNFIGLPSEPVGISNDPHFFLRRPRFDEAAFTATDRGADLVITLRDLP